MIWDDLVRELQASNTREEDGGGNGQRVQGVGWAAMSTRTVTGLWPLMAAGFEMGRASEIANAEICQESFEDTIWIMFSTMYGLAAYFGLLE
jgi:hypothetical protein